jgi:hypothetical protein
MPVNCERSDSMLFLRKSLSSGCLLCFILVSLVGCATKTPVAPRPDDREVLEKRVREYWEYMINLSPQNVEKAYRCEAPFFRDKVSLPEYIHRYKTHKYLSIDIKEIAIEGNEGKVAIAIDYRVALPHIPKTLTKHEVEKWVKIEGTWYHIPGEWL